MSVLSFFLLSTAAVSILLNVWQWIAGRGFPMRRPVQHTGFSPALSILKPLKGCDPETEGCLESWFQQAYPGDAELLFGVASADDPVCGLVRSLIAKYPERKAELIISSPQLGPNGKVSSLCYLSQRARHEHLVISDADVYVENDFLVNLVAGLREERVGLVNCFYILAKPQTFAMRLEAVAVNADFWTQVLQGISLRRMTFALGAAMAVRKRELQRIGGFEALLELLADDYHLGNRIAKAGRELTLCPIPVECRTARQGARAVWRHQLRWARTIQVCQPRGYFFSILANGTLWPMLALPAGMAGRWICITGLVVRMLTAVSNEARLTGQRHWRTGLLAPCKDLAHAALWVASFCGHAITWHGQRFRVSRGGKLTPMA